MQGYMDSLCHSVDQGVYTDDPKQKAEIECIYSMVELYRANKIPTDNDIITIRKHFNADQLPNSGKCEFVNSLISLMMRRAGAYSTVKMGYVSIDKNVAKQTWSSMIYQNDTDYVAPHFWCQWGSNIIDATADQFGTFAPPIIRASKKQAKSGLFGIRYYSTNK